MNLGRTVFSQLISFLPDRELRRCVSRYDGDRRWRGFSCWDQFLSMAFAQLTYRESLRDIEACLRSLRRQALPDMGFHSQVAAPHWPTPTSRGLADLCRFRPGLDSHRAALVRPRSDRPGSRSKSLRSSTTIDLCLSVLGQVPPAQGCPEDAHAVGPARQHPQFIRVVSEIDVARRLLPWIGLRRFRVIGGFGIPSTRA